MPLFNVKFSDGAPRETGLFFDHSEVHLRLSFKIWRHQPISITECLPGSRDEKYIAPSQPKSVPTIYRLLRIRTKAYDWKTLTTICEYLYGAARGSKLDVESLEQVTERGIRSSKVRKAIRDICESYRTTGDIRYSATLFPDRIAPIIDRVLERAQIEGSLSEAFGRIIDQCTSNSDKKNSTVYWLQVIGVAWGIVFLFLSGMNLTIVESFEKIYGDMNAQLPASTQLVISMKYLFSLPVLLFLLFIALAVTTLKRKISSAGASHDLIFSLPILGQMQKDEMLAQYSAWFNLLKQLGVTDEEALMLLSKSFISNVAEQSLHGAFTLRCSGLSMSEALTAGPFFSSMIAWMAETDREIIWSRHVKKVTSRNEVIGVWMPIICVVGGGIIVGFYIIALFMPIMSLSSIVGS